MEAQENQGRGKWPEMVAVAVVGVWEPDGWHWRHLFFLLFPFFFSFLGYDVLCVCVCVCVPLLFFAEESVILLLELLFCWLVASVFLCGYDSVPEQPNSDVEGG